MQFMLAIYEDEAIYGDNQDNTAWDAIIEAHTKLGEAMTKAGVIRSGEGLKPAKFATTVRTTGGKTAIHDGPYAETKEQLGGFYIIDVPDLDAAIEWAKRIPLAGNGTVEVRPTLSPPTE